MDLSKLKPGKGSNKKKKKVARGTSSGHGKTAGRGHKGQLSRAGGGKGIRFEGGQTPLYRRLPKMGTFKNYPFKKKFNILNVGQLDVFEDGCTVKIDDLIEKFFSSTKKRASFQIKILGNGEIKKNITVEANRFSEEAKKKIEEAKGKAVQI
ncbi:MAG: 50S ribosomal protein L15 [Candidatus Saganbacteria bacterium]|nr:50S ribosomal protein L15 [Candidatus Saganbacteria bacterium]